MRRQRRKRTTRRRGLQHIGDVLASIVSELDQDEATANAAEKHESTAVPVSVAAVDPQNTFAFYQPAEV